MGEIPRKRLMGYQPFLLALSIFLSGCTDSSGIEEQVRRQAELLAQQQQQIAAIENELRQLTEPKLVFTVRDLEYSINEEAFEPILVGRADISASGTSVPDIVYVEVLVSVEVFGENLRLNSSSIHRLADGKLHFEFNQALPRHNLQTRQLLVAVKPVGWFRGHQAF